MDGWLKLYRNLIEKSIWINSTSEQKVILITLLCMANHKAAKWEFDSQIYEVQPGQLVTSLPHIVERCADKDITIQKVRTALKRFEKLGFLTDKSTNKNRLITILNWGIYQDIDNENNSQLNRQLTGSQQAANRQLTSNKNVKNDKNVKNNNTLVYSPEFLQLWECYPKKTGKGKAYETFNKIGVDELLLKKMIDAVNAIKNTWDWQKENKRYVPMLTTWLNQRRWEDEIDSSSSIRKSTGIVI